MNCVTIQKLDLHENTGVDGDVAPVCPFPFEPFLKEIYLESEFIDPIDEIIHKVLHLDVDPLSMPYGVYWEHLKIGFFTIDFSNPPVDYQINDPSCCWLDSFFITIPFQGKGFAKAVLHLLPTRLKQDYPLITSLNLTVNFKNPGARALYLKCGFVDTGTVYRDGPAGPQHILTQKI